MIISEAVAMTGSAGHNAGGGDFGQFIMSILPIVAIGAVFYMFLIRPQQKKAKQHQDLLSALRKGDRVVTTGGLIGVVSKILNDREVQLEIADNVRVKVVRHMISEVLGNLDGMSHTTHVAHASHAATREEKHESKGGSHAGEHHPAGKTTPKKAPESPTKGTTKGATAPKSASSGKTVPQKRSPRPSSPKKS